MKITPALLAAPFRPSNHPPSRSQNCSPDHHPPLYRSLSIIPFLLVALISAVAPQARAASTPKVHTVFLGPVRRVPYTAPDATPDTKDEDTTTLKVRPLIIDTRQKEWTTGDLHDVTDRTYAIRRAIRINDSLPTDGTQRWVWQPAPWLLVDRVTGHITALHLPDFDPAVSNAVWYRDYAAFCGIATTAKGSALMAIVAQLGARKAIVARPVGKWPQPDHPHPLCQPAKWQRLPMRVTIQPTGSEPSTFDVVGTTSLVEEADNDEQ